ncbi:HNH endonuclease [Anaerobutyricum hallii]|uniref:HNH endonuclease n=1 Tax=Anaerobutyricum hallii TaxID=39488 RepID=UPI003522D14C
MKHNQNLGKRHAYRFYIINLRKAWRENNQRTLARQANNNCENDKTFSVQKQRSGNKQKDLNNSVVVNDTTKRTTNNAKGVTNNTKKKINDTKKRTNNAKRVANDTKKKSNSSRRKKTQGMTYSQKKRASFNYRNEYFKKNPGIYGNIWFCSQCGKILIGKHNVVIDHIMPLNNVAGVNRTFNTVAICQKCNSSKSDSVDYRVVKGYLAKLFEVFTSHLPDALALVLSLIVSLAYQIFNLLFILVTMPLTLANGKFLTYAVVIVIIFAFIFSKL